MEERYDSICIGDTLIIGDHIYTQAGDMMSDVITSSTPT